MTGRDFLAPARTLAAGPAEPFWRVAFARAYYALMLEARDLLDRWGLRPKSGENVHPFVRLRLTFAADRDLRAVGLLLDDLVRLRSKADYNLGRLAEFASATAATDAIRDVTAALARLDAVAADPARSAAAAADIRARWP